MRITLILFTVILILVAVAIICVNNYIYLYNLYVYYFSIDPLTHYLNLESIRPRLYHDLRENWTHIRDEVLAAKERFSSIRGDRFFEDSIITSEKWKKIYLKWYDEPPTYANKLFPKTMAILGRHQYVRLAMFSLLEPGCKILPHRGPFRGCIRVHLCLTSPNNELCYIKVNDERYIWKEGEILAFDDTYLHSVKNNSNTDRIVLFLDVERHIALSFINSLVITHFAKTTTRINDEIEKEFLRIH